MFVSQNFFKKDERRKLARFTRMQNVLANWYVAFDRLQKEFFSLFFCFKIFFFQIGLPAKQYNRKRFLEKAQMKKNIQMHNESVVKKKVDAPKDGDALPGYLLDREVVTRAKVCFILFYALKGGFSFCSSFCLKGLVQLFEAKAQRKGWKVERALAQSQAHLRGRNVSCDQDGKEKEEAVEENGDESDVCWRFRILLFFFFFCRKLTRIPQIALSESLRNMSVLFVQLDCVSRKRT